MKKYIKKILFFGFLITSSIAFAFPADPDPTVDPPAPIDTYIYGLVVLGIGFALWVKAKKNLKTS